MAAGHNSLTPATISTTATSVHQWRGLPVADKDAFSSDMTDLPPTALDQQAAGLIAKVPAKQSQCCVGGAQNYMHSAVGVGRQRDAKSSKKGKC